MKPLIQKVKKVASRQASSLRRYLVLAFICLVAGLYGFALFRFSSLKDAQPSQEAISSQVTAARVPHIDPTVVKKLQSLQDNSVSVQALFDQARNNPFQ